MASSLKLQDSKLDSLLGTNVPDEPIKCSPYFADKPIKALSMEVNVPNFDGWSEYEKMVLDTIKNKGLLNCYCVFKDRVEFGLYKSMFLEDYVEDATSMKLIRRQIGVHSFISIFFEFSDGKSDYCNLDTPERLEEFLRNINSNKNWILNRVRNILDKVNNSRLFSGTQTKA
jgi:hypothetical protein